jgi:flagellar motor switch/type III secretory pathway protein FliN
MSARPFPWRSLETTTRAEVAALRDARRWVAERVRFDAFAEALRELLDADVQVLVRRVIPAGAPAPPAREGTVGVLFGRADDGAGAALLEVEGALAVALTARVLRRPLPAIVGPPQALHALPARSAAIAGALAAVVAAAARRAHAGAPLRVHSAGTGEALATTLPAGAAAESVRLSLTVLVADDAFEGGLTIAGANLSALPPAAWTRRALSSLGAMPLSLPIVACATLARVADVAALRKGDVWLPGTWPLALASDAESVGSLRGTVLLAPVSSPTGVRARVEGNRLVISGEVDMLCPAEGEMTDLEGESALLDAVGDVPVIVRVEVGEARMIAREWAALGRGDVVTLGRRVGERVLLRVGGVPVARGELVSVDGEVGVRIVERLAGDATTT